MDETRNVRQSSAKAVNRSDEHRRDMLRNSIEQHRAAQNSNGEVGRRSEWNSCGMEW